MSTTIPTRPGWWWRDTSRDRDTTARRGLVVVEVAPSPLSPSGDLQANGVPVELLAGWREEIRPPADGCPQDE